MVGRERANAFSLDVSTCSHAAHEAHTELSERENVRGNTKVARSPFLQRTLRNKMSSAFLSINLCGCDLTLSKPAGIFVRGHPMWQAELVNVCVRHAMTKCRFLPIDLTFVTEGQDL